MAKNNLKMKKIIFGLIAIFLVSNLSFAQSDIKSKLLVLENTLDKLIDNETTYTINNVLNSKNKYDAYGQNTYSTFARIDSFLEKFKEKPNYEADVKSYIQSEIKNIIPYDTNFKDDAELVYNSYTNSLKFKNSIQISKAYENFISDNFQNQSEVKNLLELISNTKFSVFKAKGSGKRTFSVRENCANGCMQDMFEGFNPIQWAEFTIGFLGGSLFWAYGSCWYDCW